MKIALAGNPNSGKTTLFNDLTGSSQYVGNWPGVTVEKKEGKLKKHKDVIIQDLPGIYSLSPYSMEEVISRRYLVNEKPDAIINIIDGTNIERNLYLTTQLLELGLPMVVAVNMMDLVEKNGDHIDMNALEKMLGCHVMPISALKGKGSREVAELAISIADKKVLNRPELYEGPLLSTIKSIESELSNVDQRMKRWFAVKVFERDEKVINELNLSSLLAKYEKNIKKIEDDEDDDAESIITTTRYEYISNIVNDCVTRKSSTQASLSDKIDKIVTNRILALPIFAVIMTLMFKATIDIGGIAQGWVEETLFGEWIMPFVEGLLKSLGVNSWITDLVVNGIINTCGFVLTFLPLILILFLFISILEDSGYMARVAFIMDRIFRKFGLSGKSFIPILIGAGCGVPAIMGTRTIENEKDRRMTIMLATFIPCSAKLEIITIITAAFFKEMWWLAPAMYFLGMAIIILSGIALKKTRAFAGEVAPFVMELPAYHVPQVKTVLLRVWDRAKEYVIKAGTIIFTFAVILWFLSNHTWSLQYIDGESAEIAHSMLRSIGEFIAPLFKPLGFGNWQGGVAVLVAEGAKELAPAIVDTLAGKAGITSLFTPMAAFSFMTLNLFDPPCTAAMGAIMREMGDRKWGVFAILYQVVLGYAISFVFYNMGSWLFYGASFGLTQIISIVIIFFAIYMVVRPAPKAKISAAATLEV